MTTSIRVIAAVCSLVLLPACGLLKSPAEDITFQAPSGWTSTPGIMGRFQLWTGGSATKQVLMLMKLPQDTKMNGAFSDADFKEMSAPTRVKDATVVERRSMNICGDQPALYMKMRGVSVTTNNEKTEELIETVLSKVPDGTYMAMHMYPVGSAPDPQAEAAIYELCPKR